MSSDSESQFQVHDSINCDKLWLKATKYMDRVYAIGAEDETAPLWASLAMEHLVKAALGKISPALIVDSKREDQLIGAFGGVAPKQWYTITMSIALTRAVALIAGFTEEDAKAANALALDRNGELHSGHSSYAAYHPSLWEPTFYKAAIPLVEFLNRTLDDFVGSEERAVAAKEQAEAAREDLRKEAMTLVQVARASYEQLHAANEQEVQVRIRFAQSFSKEVTSKRASLVDCPSCQNKTAVLEGKEIERSDAELGDSDLTVRITMLPSKLHCSVCGLHLTGISQLQAFQLGGRYDVYSHQSLSDFYADYYADDDYDD